MSLIGGIMKGVSAGAAGAANAQIDRQNANIANQAAGSALEAGQQSAGIRAMQGSRLSGSQTAGMSASGVVANSGSALGILGDTAAVSKQDQDVIQNNAARTAWGYKAQATNFDNKATLDAQEGQSQEFGDILGGVTGAATSMMKLGN